MLGLRTIVVVGAAIMLLPSDPVGQQALVTSVRSNAEWVWTYCDREPASCEKAKQTALQFGAKAKFAAQLVGDLIKQQVARGDTMTTPESAMIDTAPVTGSENELGTLLDSWEQEQASSQ